MFPGDRVGKIRYPYHPRNQLQGIYRQLLKMYAPYFIPGLSENVVVIAPEEKQGSSRWFAELLYPAFRRGEYEAPMGWVVYRKSLLRDLLVYLSQYHQADPWCAMCRLAMQCDPYAQVFLADAVYGNYSLLRTGAVESFDCERGKYELPHR